MITEKTLTQKQIDFLREEIVRIASHIENKMDAKANLLRGYNDEIKRSKKRFKSFIDAVKLNKRSPLENSLSETELDNFDRL